MSETTVEQELFAPVATGWHVTRDGTEVYVAAFATECGVNASSYYQIIGWTKTGTTLGWARSGEYRNGRSDTDIVGEFAPPKLIDGPGEYVATDGRTVLVREFDIEPTGLLLVNGVITSVGFDPVTGESECGEFCIKANSESA